MNSVQQIGRLTADPEPVKETEKGHVTTFRIAVNRPKGSAKGADFFTVEAWGAQADTCAQYLREGREVGVLGRLEQREWRTLDDQTRERVVIVARTVDFLRGRRDGEPVAASPDEAIAF